MGVTERKKEDGSAGRRVTLRVDPSAAGERLDVWLTERLPDLSRSRLQSLVKSGAVTVDGRAVRPSHPVVSGIVVEIVLPEPAPVLPQPEEIPLRVIYEDPDIIVVNKAAGMVVHPAGGHQTGTLVNALLHHCTDLAGIGGEHRPGIVHRLDRDTSGVIVVVKNDRAMRIVANQFKKRRVGKVYLAVVHGVPRNVQGRIETLIGRSSHDRKKMSAAVAEGRNAVTRYAVEREFGIASLVRVELETGRTHQVRVHMTHVGHPLVGDRQYGRRHTTEIDELAGRQMLHAHSLTIRHPATNNFVTFTAPVPTDMAGLLAVLEKKAAERR